MHYIRVSKYEYLCCVIERGSGKQFAITAEDTAADVSNMTGETGTQMSRQFP